MESLSTSAPDHRGKTGNLPRSHFQQTVCLADWWLVKAEKDVQGRRLAVAGFTDWGKQAMRVFTSAPILKRYDVFTVETTDGICVVLKGFINKTRTLENGFPSNVFNYFVFGFPPYWKEYDEKFVAKEPPLSKDVSKDDLLEKLSRQLGSMEAAQQHVDSHEKNSKSQGKMEAKGRQKSKKTKSLIGPLPKKCSVNGLQKESHGGTSVEDHTAPELLVNCLKNETKSLSDLSCGGSIKVPEVIDKLADYSQILDSGGTLSACHLNKKRSKEAADNLTKMDRDKKTRTNFDWDMSSSEKILSRNEGRVTTRSMSSLKMKQTNNQRSAGIPNGKVRLNSITSISSGKLESDVVFDREPGSNNWNYEDKSMREIKTKSKTQKEKNKATELPCTSAASSKSCRTPAAVDNQRDTVSTGKISLSEKAKASDMETSRKLGPVSKGTPESEKEKVQSVSPQSFSFNRSRSGRLLMPTLEFWRNQRAIYNAGRTITGIDEGMHPQQLRNEGGSTLHGKESN